MTGTTRKIDEPAPALSRLRRFFCLCLIAFALLAVARAHYRSCGGWHRARHKVWRGLRESKDLAGIRGKTRIAPWRIFTGT